MLEKDISIEFLKASIDSLYYSILVDEQGNIKRMSQNYLEMANKTLEEVYNKPVDSIIPNTKIMEVLDTQTDDVGSIFIMLNGKKVICNRICVYVEGELKGVIASASFANFGEFDILNTEISSLEKEKEFYRNTLKETQGKLFSANPIIGNSDSMKKIKNTISEVAESDLTVLFTGETGTGKEVLANKVQSLSKRKYENFIKINCAAIPETLLESELFGYEGGTFTGALDEGKKGKFELADKGTLLLDEIGEMSLELQSKLLRVLQEKEIDKIGGTHPIPIDVRLICSTNQNLNELVAEGKFREDLYYRINIVEIEVPPLRERMTDLKLLVDFFVKKINKDYGLYIREISKDVFDLLEKHDWRGNVRELEHVLERPMVIKKTGVLDLEDFDFFKERIEIESLGESNKYSQSNLRKLEIKQIKHSLIEAKNNKSKAAKMLGISRGTLYNRINEYDIDIFS